MRCYFNLSNGDRSFEDEDGIEVASLDEAHGQALQAIREMSVSSGAAGFDWSGWDLSVVDNQGNLLIALSLEEVVSRTLAAKALWGGDTFLLQ